LKISNDDFNTTATNNPCHKKCNKVSDKLVKNGLVDKKAIMVDEELFI
jgi:methionyl-tRNA synthetase